MSGIFAIVILGFMGMFDEVCELLPSEVFLKVGVASRMIFIVAATMNDDVFGD